MADFERVESLLSSLKALISWDEGKRGVEEAQEFIDHREYGLALESLVYELVARRRIPSVDELALVEEAATSMKLDPQALLAEMTGRASR